MLVLEGLVNAQVVVAPGEMSSGPGLLTCTRGTSDGIHGDILL